MINSEFKKRVFSHCIEEVRRRLDLVNSEILHLQTSANEETKSTAGDKYETGRAMIMIDQERLIMQQQEWQRQLNLLQSIASTTVKRTVELGALVQTSEGLFYIACSLGIIKIDDRDVMVISSITPIGQLLLDRKTGEKIVFKNRPYLIEEIY